VNSSGLGQNLVNFLTTVALLGVIGYIGIDLYRAAAGADSSLDVPARTEPLRLAGAATMGSPNAKAGLIVFSDFECGSCGRFARETLSFLRYRYVDQNLLKIAYRHYLLPTHQHAMRLAQAAHCAAAEGRFWDAHDRILGTPSTNFRLVSGELPGELGLDETAFASCLSADERTFIEDDRRLAVRLGVTGTPTVFIGRFAENDVLLVSAVIRGAQPTAVFRDAIERVLH
jgi:protein-disulfide isomerase